MRNCRKQFKKIALPDMQDAAELAKFTSTFRIKRKGASFIV